MTKYAFDTNVIIDYLRGNENIKKKIVISLSMGDILTIPSIAYYEVMRGFKESEATKRLNNFKMLLKNLQVLYLEENNMQALNMAARIYERLRKSGKLIEDNVIYIAATAIANDAVLVTDNIKHFSRVEGLNLVNWKE